jgi:hypothetical protein
MRSAARNLLRDEGHAPLKVLLAVGAGDDDAQSAHKPLRIDLCWGLLT